MGEQGFKPVASIIVMAYNNLDYTRLCIESLYRNTQDVDFELITVNNGSTDGTKEFFDTLYNRKKINIEKNSGTINAFNKGLQSAEGEYAVFVSNDLILTPRWLDNLLRCVRSDERIGMAVPVCNFSSNFQQMGLGYANIAELYTAAGKFNRSDPSKWEERLRLITYAFASGTDLLKRLGGYDEIYSPYSFDDDDLSFRIRRAGYRLILAADTYVHHFGSLTKRKDSTAAHLQERNRRIFSARFGVDAWEDTEVDSELLKLIDFKEKDEVDILGAGFRCGGTLLQAKNGFRGKGCRNVRLWGLTEDEKYLPDLKTICSRAVCGGTENIFDVYNGTSFDCVMLNGETGNIGDPEALIKKAAGILKDDGQLIISISNALFYENVMSLLGGRSATEGRASGRDSLSLNSLIDVLYKYGFQRIKYFIPKAKMPEEYAEALENLKRLSPMENKEVLMELFCAKRLIISAEGIKRAKKVLFYPGYDLWENDGVFLDGSLGNSLGVDTGGNFAWMLREEFRKYGYAMSAFDNAGDIDDAEYVIFNDMPKYYANPFFTGRYHEVYKGRIYFDEFLKRKASGKTNAKLVVRLEEPPFVMPENYDKNMLENADVIFTYRDDLVDNKKYFKYFIPQPESVHNPYIKNFDLKKLFTLVGSNKRSGVHGELYSERRRAIEFFEKNHIGDFDLYGKQWECAGYKCYRGEIANKLEIMSGYKFCLCYENGILNGWISERIFECFHSRCVPVYLGAPNITDYVPDGTFIDKREFDCYESLYDYTCSMSEDRYNQYLENIEDFLASGEYKKLTRSRFAENFVSALLKN